MESTTVPRGYRHRSRLVVFVLAVTVLAGIAGFVVGSNMQSAADAAAGREPPEPSVITVAVERRTLEATIILRGVAEFPDAIPIELAGAVGGDAERQVVTVAADRGRDVGDGSVIAEVSGRPVIVVDGAEPAFRTLRFQSTGNDVAQLEEALVRFGFDPGDVDGVFTRSTAQAVADWYGSLGFVADGRTSSSTRDVVVPAGEVVFLSQLPARISDVFAEAGAVITGPFAAVTTGKLRIVAPLTATNRSLVRVGMAASLELGGEQFDGEVSALTENVDGSFEVVVETSSDLPIQLTSLSARIELPVAASNDEVLAVPIAAVSTDAAGSEQVTVLHSDGTTEDVLVATGLVAEGYVEVTGNLREGQLVIVGRQ